MDKAKKHALGWEDSPICQYCQHPVQDNEHIIWKRSEFHKIRTKHFPGLTCHSFDHMSSRIKKGIAIAMSSQQHQTYWGGTAEGLQTDEAKAFGVDDIPYTDPDMASVLAHAEYKNLNARQTVETSRAVYDVPHITEFPANIVGAAAGPEPDVYSDGGLANPTVHKYGIAGYGIVDTIRSANDNEPDCTNMETATTNGNCMHQGGGHCSR